MKILLVGRGWVGNKMYQELVSRTHTVTVTPHTEAIDLLNSNKNFDWVVNCAGVTGIPNVDACESNKKLTIEGNSIYPVLLYDSIKYTNIRFAHFSSGCIYDGLITETNAEPNYFGSIYSVSKAVSDSYLVDKAVVYRIRMPFTNSREEKNLLTKIDRYAKTAKLMEGGDNSITDLDESIKVACNILERNEPNGPYNLVNKGSVTMHDIVELMQISAKWFTPEEFKSVTLARRSNCVIPSYQEMSDVKDALISAIQTFKIN